MERIFRVGLVVAVLAFIGLALFLETLPTGGQVVSGPGGGTTSSSADASLWGTNAVDGGITNVNGLLTLNGHATIGTAGQASFADGGVLINADGRLDAVSLTVSDVHFLNLDGSAHLGDEALVISAAGNVTAAHNLTVSGLTASRLVLTDGSKVLTSAAASGAVPVNADGSETTAAQVNAVFLNNTPTRFVFDGDSLTSSNFTYPYWLFNLSLTNNTFAINATNVAVSGQTVDMMIGRYTNFVRPFRPASGTNAFLFGWGGINDIFFNTNNLATIQNSLSNYWTMAKQDGFTVVAFTVSDRGDFPSALNEFERSQLNDFIRSSPLWDYLVDVESLYPVVSSYYLSDNIHFGTNAQRVLAAQAYNVLTRPAKIATAPRESVHSYTPTNFFADGAAGLPSISFASEKTTGFYRASSGFIGIYGAGSGVGVISINGVRLTSTVGLQFSSGSGISTSQDTGVFRNSAGVVEINNGTMGTWRDLKLRTLITDQTITAPGTTGAQTINKASGRVNIAAGGTSVVVTDSLVTANTIVIAVAATADATAKVTSVVAASGSFTINTTACTAETAFNFWLSN